MSCVHLGRNEKRRRDWNAPIYFFNWRKRKENFCSDHITRGILSECLCLRKRAVIKMNLRILDEILISQGSNRVMRNLVSVTCISCFKKWKGFLPFIFNRVQLWLEKPRFHRSSQDQISSDVFVAPEYLSKWDLHLFSWVCCSRLSSQKLRPMGE